MDITPLGDRVLVQVQNSGETEDGGIIIPDIAKEAPQEAMIVAVGDGRRNADGDRIPVRMSIGDLIIMPKFGGVDVKFDGEDYKIIREEDVLAIVG